MEEKVLTSLLSTSRRLMMWVRKFPKRRFLYDELRKIDEEYYVGVKGIRGVGKTVLLLQLANETEKSVYFSADSTLIKPFSIYEVVKSLAELGYRNIFIDEIHRKPNWAEDLKTLYDEHEVRIFFSGSSAIDIVHLSADLSRRVVLKELPPASFREWLNIKKGFSIPRLSLKTVLSKSFDLTNMYMELHSLWQEYMSKGGVLYPESGFYEALENSIRKVILEDLSSLREINVKYETDAFKLLYLVAKSAPFEVKYSTIANELDVSKNMAIRLVEDLSKAGLIYPIQACGSVRKEPKLYLTIPLRKFFAKKGFSVNLGALREEFFINHVRWISEICYLKGKRGEKTPDFKVGEWIIEVGGEKKSRYQKPDYIAVDGLLTGKGRISLFLFGLIY
ncbi:ATP-binding protein [Thermococci archaeon]|nr:MAG: ATP-binding protein [Thermococci archaeon]RLF82219.1 MAG: ATP-binding protein [Thermococci archaeon]